MSEFVFCSRRYQKLVEIPGIFSQPCTMLWMRMHVKDTFRLANCEDSFDLWMAHVNGSKKVNRC